MKTRTTQLTLVDAPLGLRVRIRHMNPHPEVSLRLRELGFRENETVRCLHRGNGNMICQIRNVRIGLDNDLARSIIVSAHEEREAAAG